VAFGGAMIASFHPMGETFRERGLNMKNQQPSRLPFKLDSAVDDSPVTSRTGVPLAVELFRASGAGRKRARWSMSTTL
jgi:hypothetical protein